MKNKKYSDEQTVSGADVYKDSKIKAFAGNFATCLAVTAIVGSIFAIAGNQRESAEKSMANVGKECSDTFSISAERMSDSTLIYNQSPFADFAQTEFCMPDFNTVPALVCPFKDHFTAVPFYSGKTVSPEQRQKIAEFINSQNPTEITPEEDEKIGTVNMESPYSENISFQYISDSKAVQVLISDKEKLIFNSYDIVPDGDAFYAQNSVCHVYTINWNDFKTALVSILGEDAVKQADFGETAKYVPFECEGFEDMYAIENIIQNFDFKNNSAPPMNLTGTSTSNCRIVDFPDGNVSAYAVSDSISYEKRCQLSEFLGSLLWEQVTEPEFNIDTLVADCNCWLHQDMTAFDGSDIVQIYIDTDSVELKRISCTKQNGRYICSEVSRVTYKTDYEYFWDNIVYILDGNQYYEDYESDSDDYCQYDEAFSFKFNFPNNQIYEGDYRLEIELNCDSPYECTAVSEDIYFPGTLSFETTVPDYDMYSGTTTASAWLVSQSTGGRAEIGEYIVDFDNQCISTIYEDFDSAYYAVN